MQKIKSIELERIINSMITRQIQMTRDQLDYDILKRQLNDQAAKEQVLGISWVLNEDCSLKEIWEFLPSEQQEVERKTINNNAFVQRKAMRGI